MQSTVVKLCDYMKTEIPEEMRKWRVTDEEIAEALKLLGKDHAIQKNVETVEKGDSVSCICTEGTDAMKARTVLLYPGRKLPGAEEAEKAVIGRQVGDVLYCNLGSYEVTVQIKEILRLTDMPVGDHLVQEEKIQGVNTVEEFYHWYREENTPKKRERAQQIIAGKLFEEIESKSELMIDEEEKKQWSQTKGKFLYDMLIQNGRDPHIPEDGFELLSDEEALARLVVSQETLFNRAVISFYIATKDGYICSRNEFEEKIRENINQGLMEEKDADTLDFEMYADYAYENKAAEILIKKAECFLEV